MDSVIPWESVSVEDGLTLQKRAVASSSSNEYRVTVQTQLTVAALCDAVFEWGTRGTDVPGLKLRRELFTAPDERVVYDQHERPVVSNRDYAITVRRSREGADVCRIRYWATNEMAPKQLEGWVRLDMLWGSWSFTAAGSGTELVYTQFVDPGGRIPAFIASGTQREAALSSVRSALEKGRAWRP